jgi:hypothetical protein
MVTVHKWHALTQSPIVVREAVDSVERQSFTIHFESNSFRHLSPTADHGVGIKNHANKLWLPISEDFIPLYNFKKLCRFTLS